MQHEPSTFHEFQDTRTNISYEVLLGRQVDRCLFFRTTDPMRTYIIAVHGLDLSLVDLPGKPLRSEFDKWLAGQDSKLYIEGEFAPHVYETVVAHDNAFKEITRILSRFHMLFRSQMIEVNR